MGKGSSAPPAPDYAGAAQATAAGNKDAAIAAQQGSMVNQYTPYGNLTYTPGANTAQGNPTYNANYSLSDVGQKLLDYGNDSALGLGALQNDATNRTAQSFGQPFDINSANDAVNKAYGNITSRLDPQWNQASASKETDLVNQGLRPGMEAYDNAMRDFNYGKNDAYTQANTQAMNMAPQTMQLDLAARNQPLNELNALRTGSQVTNPTFQTQPSQQTVAGPNLLGAAQSQGQYDSSLYNAQQAQGGNFMSGLMGMAGTLGGAALKAGMFSDRRLKSNVVRVGTHKLGIGVYEYDIFGSRQRGVMADELEAVLPSAVSTHASGYKMVDYDQLETAAA